MTFLSARNRRDGFTFGRKIRWARSFSERMVGLMFKREMQGYDGLLIEPCNSIHTFFMNFKIDALFLNEKNEVVEIYRELPPWRVTRMVFKARKVLELPPGTVPSGAVIGDQVEVICLN